MATTYGAIATVTVGSGGAANIEFTSIPQTYTDLKLVYSLRNARNLDTDSISITINTVGVGTSLSLRGNGSIVVSFTETKLNAGRVVSATATANTFNSGEIYFPNYASNVNNKSYSSDTVTENNNTQAFQQLDAVLYPSTEPITNLTIFGDNGNLVEYSTATLYGIKNS